MSDPSDRPAWSDGLSLEGIPYERQPKVMVTVCRFVEVRGHLLGLPLTRHDITDWLQSNPQEQLRILDAIEALLDGSTNLDDLGDLDCLDDGASGEYLLDLTDGPGLPAGPAGTDVHLLSAYARYVRDCRDQDYIPFSDVSGHAERTASGAGAEPPAAGPEDAKELPRVFIPNAPAELLVFSHSTSPEQQSLWKRSRPLFIES